MKESNLRNLAKDFALQVISFCDTLDQSKGRAVLINQLIRSSSSIGANIHEANYAASKADFINKLHIALKECFETEYWLELLGAVNLPLQEELKNLLHTCGIIRKMLVASINTAKK